MAASPHVRKAALFDKAASATYLGSILVLNAEGKVTLKAGAESLVDDSFSDRDFFKAHQESSNLGLYVGDPYVSPLHGYSM